MLAKKEEVSSALFTFTPVKPFEPVSGTSVPQGPEWIHQIKWDGVRMLSYYDGETCRLFNRKGNERTRLYPELTEPSEYCSASSFILDGEVIALAVDGKPSFHEVMKRDAIRKQDKIRFAAGAVPVTYMVFDILYCEGEWVTSRKLAERQRLLAEVLSPGKFVQSVGSFADGDGLFKLMREQGMEGIVSKDSGSVYALDGKDKRWVKVKNYGDLIAVIGGFTLNGGAINAVLAGVYDGAGRLIYIGHVGTGKLTRGDWTRLTAELKPDVISECPFANRHPEMKGATWVKPRVAMKVQYTEWRWQEGRTLRQPSIQAFVEAEPAECRFPF
ncbi:DNA ligase [Paenibacillus filicis]|uniref:DNA ligase (ATP) n=1 Tax=Paenibacillus gyeongsangnamensis TaxID=3388067 RepID=A0ABT4QG12_9BACL|nr:RNA ligase family protein [Paenibacillus filicis]MCZ8515676.1 DNA ligase [Paenibacillus filicis]